MEEMRQTTTDRWIGANRRLHAELRTLSRLSGVPLPPGAEPFGGEHLTRFIAAVSRQLTFDGRAEMIRERQRNGGHDAES